MIEPALAGTEVHSLILYALLVFISLLIGAVFFFVKKLITKVDLMWDKLLVLEVGMHNFSDDFAYIKSVKSDLRDRFDDLVILKRDQTSIWKKLDLIQARVGMNQ